MEEEAQAREEILRRSDEERQARDKARREELRRQEELLSGRKIRSKTIELSSDDVRGGVGNSFGPLWLGSHFAHPPFVSPHAAGTCIDMGIDVCVDMYIDVRIGMCIYVL